MSDSPPFDKYEYEVCEEEYCETCHNLGYIVTCIDDLCASNDHCIHGDGEEICPDCKGRYL